MMSLSSDKRRSEIQAWGVYMFLRMSNLGLAFDFRWQLNYGFPLCSKCRPPGVMKVESISWWNCVSFPWKCFLFVKSAENFLIQCLVKSSRVFPRVEIFFWKSACFIYDLQAVRTDNFSVNLFPWALFSGYRSYYVTLDLKVSHDSFRNEPNRIKFRLIVTKFVCGSFFNLDAFLVISCGFELFVVCCFIIDYHGCSKGWKNKSLV